MRLWQIKTRPLASHPRWCHNFNTSGPRRCQLKARPEPTLAVLNPTSQQDMRRPSMECPLVGWIWFSQRQLQVTNIMVFHSVGAEECDGLSSLVASSQGHIVPVSTSRKAPLSWTKHFFTLHYIKLHFHRRHKKVHHLLRLGKHLLELCLPQQCNMENQQSRSYVSHRKWDHWGCRQVWLAR